MSKTDRVIQVTELVLMAVGLGLTAYVLMPSTQEKWAYRATEAARKAEAKFEEVRLFGTELGE